MVKCAMSKTRARLQTKITRVLKGVDKAGVHVRRLEIEPDGKIVVFTGKPGEETTNLSDLDRWMAEHAGTTERH